jgi:RNA polymerase sigma-70 factor (sigma-E family)
VSIVVSAMRVSEEWAEMSERGTGPAGDPPDFSMFCRSEYPVLIGMLTLLAGDRWSAEDLAQEALARAWVRWSRVGGLERPDLWTKRVAVNLAHSSWRHRQLADRAAVTLRASPTVAATVGPTEPDDELLDVVGSLPARQRSAIALRFFADMTVADTARVIGCREGTVKGLTSQAIASLRRVLVTDQEVDDER